MKKYMIYGGAFLASLALINTGMYFFLNATQPKSMLLAEHVDSLATHSEIDSSIHAPTDSTLVVHEEHLADSIAIEDSLGTEDEYFAEESEYSDETDYEAEAMEPEGEEVTSTSIAEAMAGDPKQLSKLAKVMDGMKANDAAAIASQLPVDVIITVLMKMKDRNAAKMMASLPTEQAARVAMRMTELASARPS